MSTDITISLPDAVCQSAAVWAKQAGRSLPDFLTDAIETSLVSLGSTPPPVETWPDDELLAAANASLSPQDDQRLGELLAMQRESSLHDQARSELARLMQSYQEGLVRKAAALREAVRRGLRGPLET
ncbi:MAG TPA: hypothetical protein VGM76_02265 [Lacipirellulaceae bacterium]